jgi:hypothetical protein
VLVVGRQLQQYFAPELRIPIRTWTVYQQANKIKRATVLPKHNIFCPHGTLGTVGYYGTARN